jgi:hypothetical protein
LLVATLTASLAPTPGNATDRHTDEASLRAAVVLGILRYTGWSQAVDRQPDISLCTMGEPESAHPLKQAVKKVQVKGKSATVNDLSADQQNAANPCHVVIYGPDARPTGSEDFLKTALTICDGCKSAHHEAAITLVRRQNRIGFEVDLKQANSSGITFSSSLLELAAKVEGARQ